MPLTFDIEQFPKDAAGCLPEGDITILVTMVREAQSRFPVSAVAHQLGITHGRVRHRTFKSLEAMKAFPSLSKYRQYVEEVMARPTVLLREPPKP